MTTDIVFIQQFPVPYFGILSMDAYLAKEGFRCAVVISELEPDLIKAVKELNPALVGFSVFSSEHAWLQRTSRVLHKAFPHLPLVVGGVHAMIYPEEILRDTACQIICYGDGENVIVDLVGTIKRIGKEGLPRVPGILYRETQGAIRKNPVALPVGFCEDAVEDRGIYFDRYPALKKNEIAFFMSSRGCPYACTFCYNSYLRELCGRRPGDMRQKKPQVLIEEIRRLINCSPVEVISFLDDMFTFNVLWLEEFLGLYRTHFSIPFGCSTRANHINKGIASLLARSGCRFASFGIETGNEDIRRRVLSKHISNDEIIRAGKLLSQAGIMVRSSNMFCLPGETLPDALSTVALNIKAKVRSASSVLLLPHPKTRIARYCLENGFLKKELTLSDLPRIAQSRSILNLAEKREITNVHYLAYWFVRYPWLFRAAKGLVNLGWLNGFFYLIFLWGFLVRNKNESGLTWLEALRFGWKKKI